MNTCAVDFERLMKLRLAVARFGEMDHARWWNTSGQLGPLGRAALRRGFPRTHRFVQARSVFAVAAQRTAELFDPPGCVTLWRLTEALEEEFEARWDQWLNDSARWTPFFEQIELPGEKELLLLAKHGCDLEEWMPVLLWHITRDEFLFRDFLLGWLFPAFEAGVHRLRPEELLGWLRGLSRRGARTEHDWSESTSRRVAAGLLGMAVDFGLLRGGSVKEFATYHLPERSFLYLLHAMREELESPAKLVESPDWRMFLMRVADVERYLLRLHQFRKLDYQVAGSLVQLDLPCSSARAYAETMVA